MAQDLHPRRYEGTRWAVLFGCYEGPQQLAVDRLQAALQRMVPYVAQVRPAGQPLPAEVEHLAIVGTLQDNPLLAELAARGAIDTPSRPQGYSITALANPLKEGGKIIAIAGYDPAGVLYGVIDLAARLRVLPVEEHPQQMRDALDSVPAMRLSDHPRIDHRGIWTWGYVIYDYIRFLDRMTAMRMNMLTIWNDLPPLNIERIIDEAHARGIKIVLGFHWGWGLTGVNLADEKDRRQITQSVLENYRRNYAHLKHDGIYFQTLTEHTDTSLGGMSTAKAACLLVDETARALWQEHGDICIQFGLHASSIRENYVDLAELDKRVVIAWEDAGLLPYAYEPDVHDIQKVWPEPWPGFSTLQGTIDYSRKLATFRPDTEFAMVPKGWSTLRWSDEFEHHGPFILGRRDRWSIDKDYQRRLPRFEHVDALWMKNYPLAAEFYRQVLACRPPRMTVTGLVEQMLIERTLPASVSLFAQTIWNPFRGDGDILAAAMNPCCFD